MDQDAKIYVAGHRGLVGSAVMRNLRDKGFGNLVTRSHAELDLTSRQLTATQKQWSCMTANGNSTPTYRTGT
jgi:nucleoside-diphosphate-sugar epimerase